MGWGVLATVTYLLRFFLTVSGGLGGQIFNFPLECSTTSLRSLLSFFARLAVNIRLIALIAMPVFG